MINLMRIFELFFSWYCMAVVSSCCRM